MKIFNVTSRAVNSSKITNHGWYDRESLLDVIDVLTAREIPEESITITLDYVKLSEQIDGHDLPEVLKRQAD